MHKESLCDNCSTNSYLKVCDLQSALNSSDSHPHSCKHTHTHTYATNLPGNALLQTPKHMPRHQIYTSSSLYKEPLLTDCLLNSKHCVHIETNWSLLLPNSIMWHFQTEEALYDSLPAARVCDFHHRRNGDYVFYADWVYKQTAFSFPSQETKIFFKKNVGLGIILGQEIAKDQIIPYCCRKPTKTSIENKGNPQKQQYYGKL